MVNSKENDWVLNILSNPQMDVDTFEEVGLNATNTSLEDKETYLKIDKIKNHEMFLTNGQFDLTKFDNFYDVAQLEYNVLTRDTQAKELSTFVNYYKTDIFTPNLKKQDLDLQLKPTTTLLFMGNPDKSLYGVDYLGSTVSSGLSTSEKAQTNKILLNPEQVDFENGDFSKALWGPSVNDISLTTNPLAYFKNFLETLVLSTWKEDGLHKDPLTGQIVRHKKGDYRTNEYGEPFYENLNGREVYGEKVLSKWDYLTVDGTKINSLDFFDSDDKEKSIAGTFMREAVELVPLFIPGVNSVYVGGRVVLLAALMFTLLDKLIVDLFYDGTPMLNDTLGLFESLGSSTSEYSQLKTLTGENILTMASDVVTLLLELRWLFRTTARLGASGKDLTDNKTIEKLAKQFGDEIFAEDAARSSNDVIGLYALSLKKGLEKVKELQRTAQSIGEEMSRLYMTILTVADAYGEAKEAGASDMGAAALTLGYALGEYGILRTDIGKWILPELKELKFHMKEMVRALMQGRNPLPEGSVDKNVKLSFTKRLINLGRSIAHADYAGVKGRGVAETLAIAAQNAAGEGVEETSEELLYDAVKSIGNLVAWVKGSDVDFKPFENAGARYGMSFFGGALGGGIAQLDPGYLKARFTRGLMTYDLAMQELVWLIGEHKEDQFLKVLDKMPVNNKFLTTLDNEWRDLALNLKQGSERDNMDVASKKLIHQAVDFFRDVLDAHGANISAKSVLNANTEDILHNLRVEALSNSAVAASFILAFNTARAELLAAEIELAKITNPGRDTYSDANKKEYFDKKDVKENVSKWEAVIKEKDAVVQSFLNGERAPKLIRMMIEEMSPLYMGHLLDVNKASFAYSIYHKPYDLLKPEIQQEINERWAKYKETGFKDNMELADRIAYGVAKLTGKVLGDFDNKYFKPSEDPVIQSLDNLLKNQSNLWQIMLDPQAFKGYLEDIILTSINNFNYTESFIDEASALMDKDYYATRIDLNHSPEVQLLMGVLNLIDITTKSESGTETTILAKTQVEQDLLRLLGAPITGYWKTLNEIKDPIEADKKKLEATEKIRLYFADKIVKTFSQLAEPFEKQGYIHPEIRRILTQALNIANTQNNSDMALMLQEAQDKYQEIEKRRLFIANIPNKKNEINQKIEELKNQVAKAKGKEPTPKRLEFIARAERNIEAYEALIEEFDNITKPLLLKEIEALTVANELIKLNINSLKQNAARLKESLKIRDLPSVPIVQILEDFYVALGKHPTLRVRDLLNKVDEILSAPSLKEIEVSDEVLEAINNTLQVLNLFEGLLIGAATDAVDTNNIWGVNKTVNELEAKFRMKEEERSHLAEMDSATAMLVRADLLPIQNKLLFLKRLYDVMGATASQDQSQITSRTYKVMYNKFKTKLLGHMRDDLWNKDDALTHLKQVMDSLLLLNQDVTKDVKTLKDFIALEAERVKFEDAIYDFFKTVTSDAESLLEFVKIFEDLEFLDTEDQLLTPEMEDLSDAHFFYWLLSATTVKSSTFLNEYNQVYKTIDKLAPFPALEIAIRMAYSTLVNGDNMVKWVRAVRPLIADLVVNKKHPSGGSLIGALFNGVTNAPFDSAVVPRFFNTILIEGVAGSGKSTGVIRTLLEMCKNNDTLKANFLKNVFVAHIGESEATEFALKNLGLEAFKAFDRETLLKFVSENNYDLRNSSFIEEDSDGKIVYKEPMEVDGEETARLNIPVASLTEDLIPSLIIIDEIGKYTTMELDLLDKFAMKYGITIIALGDLDLNKTIATGKTTNDKPINAGLYRGNFMHVPKLGFSIRADNNLKLDNLKIMQTSLKDLYPLKFDDNYNPDKIRALQKISFKYLVNEDGLYGDYLYNQEELLNEDDELPQELLNQILHMFATTKLEVDPNTGEERPVKIGYVYDAGYGGKPTKLYKYLKSAKFVHKNGKEYNCWDYINLFDKGNALGKEGQYYIVEPGAKILASEPSNFWRSLYTGMSRAALGSIIYFGNEPAESEDSPNADNPVYETLYTLNSANIVDPIITSELVPYKVDAILTPAEISNLTKIRDELISGALPEEISEIEFVKREARESWEPNVSQEVVLASSLGVSKLPDVPKVYLVTDSTPKTNPRRTPRIRIDRDKKEVTGICYSHNVHETGFITLLGEDGQEHLMPSDGFDRRIDSFNGLCHIFGINKSDARNLSPALTKQYIKLLDRLRYYARTETDYEVLLEKFTKALGLDKVGLELRFGFKKLSTSESVDPRLRLYEGEKLLNIHNKPKEGKDSSRTDIPSKNKVIICLFKDGKPILDIPLQTLPNYDTYLSKGTKEKKKGTDEFKGQIVDQEVMNAWEAAQDAEPTGRQTKELAVRYAFTEALKKMNLPEAYMLYHLLRLYNADLGTICFMDAENEEGKRNMLATTMKTSGPYLQVRSKGTDYEASGFENTNDAINPITMFSEDLNITGPLITTKGTMAKEDLRFIVIPNGHPYILATEDPDLDTEDKIISAFIEQTNRKIQRLYDKWSNITDVKEKEDFEKKYGLSDRGTFNLQAVYYDEDLSTERDTVKLYFIVPLEKTLKEYLLLQIDIINNLSLSRLAIIGMDIDLLKLFDFLSSLKKEDGSGLLTPPETIDLDSPDEQAYAYVTGVLATLNALDKQILEYERDKQFKEANDLREKKANLIKLDHFECILKARLLLVKLVSDYRGNKRLINESKFSKIEEIVKKGYSRKFYINPLVDLEASKGNDMVLYAYDDNSNLYTINGVLQTSISYGNIIPLLEGLSKEMVREREKIHEAAYLEQEVKTKPKEEPVIKGTEVKILTTEDTIKDIVETRNKLIANTIYTELSKNPENLNRTWTAEEIQLAYMKGEAGLPRRVCLLRDGEISFLSIDFDSIKMEATKNCLSKVVGILNSATVDDLFDLYDSEGNTVFVGIIEDNTVKLSYQQVIKEPEVSVKPVTEIPTECSKEIIPESIRKLSPFWRYLVGDIQKGDFDAFIKKLPIALSKLRGAPIPDTDWKNTKAFVENYIASTLTKPEIKSDCLEIKIPSLKR